MARLTAMQAQEHAYARWSIGQRLAPGATAAIVDRAFDEGEFLRTHVLRPTWHYVARGDLRWLMALSGPRVLARSARRRDDLGLDARTLSRAIDLITASVADDGPQTRRELGAMLEGKRVPLFGQGLGQRLPYVLMSGELTSAICSGPMQGRQHTYAAFDDRVPPSAALDDQAAIAQLALRYFTTRGPATLTDFVWWSGLGTREARQGLEAAKNHLSSRSEGARMYWFVEDAVPRRGTRADLVQCYDEVIISYSESRDVLQTRSTSSDSSVSFPVPRHIDGFTHVVLLDGRLAGHWRRTGPEAVETRLALVLKPAEQRALATAVDRYQRFTRVTD